MAKSIAEILGSKKTPAASDQKPPEKKPEELLAAAQQKNLYLEAQTKVLQEQLSKQHNADETKLLEQQIEVDRIRRIEVVAGSLLEWQVREIEIVGIDRNDHGFPRFEP